MRIKLSCICATTLLLSVSAPANSATVTRTTIACLSQELKDEAVGYMVKKDQEGLFQLVKSGNCTLLEVGEKVSVIHKGIMTTTIRYKGQKLFMTAENIR